VTQVLINSADVSILDEIGSIKVMLSGEVNGNNIHITVVRNNIGKWLIPVSDIDVANNSAIKIAYKYFLAGNGISKKSDELSANEILKKIPAFEGQIIAAASAATSVNW